MRNILCFALMLISISTFSQKKILDHPDFDIWNKIVNQEISSEGNFIMYSIEKGEAKPIWMNRGVPAIERVQTKGMS